MPMGKGGHPQVGDKEKIEDAKRREREEVKDAKRRERETD